MSAIDGFGKAIEIFVNEVKSDIKIQHIRMIVSLMKAHPEPVSYADLAEAAGITPSSISRNVRALGDKMIQDPKSKKWKKVGLGLCKPYPDPYNPHQYVVELSKEGIRLKHKLEKAIREG